MRALIVKELILGQRKIDKNTFAKIAMNSALIAINIANNIGYNLYVKEKGYEIRSMFKFPPSGNG